MNSSKRNEPGIRNTGFIPFHSTLSVLKHRFLFLFHQHIIPGKVIELYFVGTGLHFEIW
ncbi:hypothetical protein FHS90_002547 [Rufibacter quisquiliarum]|uniref:Uncharacterized protein n=1 Tax=Rufibacter quisquiliarum TaxID=1549639 RepID=A0A839GTU9_9BACT|nr:hypothetical protein [Rufibacter quisquiliarum]